jgi:hypothetical protein
MFERQKPCLSGGEQKWAEQAGRVE